MKIIEILVVLVKDTINNTVLGGIPRLGHFYLFP